MHSHDNSTNENLSLNEKLIRLRGLGRALLKQGLPVVDETMLAVAGECNLPYAHIIYYYIGLDYYLAIRTTKTATYRQVFIDAHTEDIRQTTISKWLYESAQGKKEENDFGK